MRTLLRSTLALLALTACSSGGDKPVLTETDPIVADSDPVIDTADTGLDPVDDFTVDFTEGRYRVGNLEILGGPGTDLDGDGTPDNQLAALLEAMSKVPDFEGMSLEQVNERIRLLLDDGTVIVLMHAEHTGDKGFSLGVVIGRLDRSTGSLVGEPEWYDAAGNPRQRLLGAFDALLPSGAYHAATDQGDLSLPFQFGFGYPVLHIEARQVMADLEVSPGTLSGYLGARFPVDSIMDNVVWPLVEVYTDDEGQRTMLMSVARGVVSKYADLDDGEAVSGTFAFSARASDWTDPTPE